MSVNKDFTHTTPEWFRDAKFGIFIHYGIYSVPAFGDEWYGHWMYKKDSKTWGGSDIYTYHMQTYGGAANFGYKDFLPKFAENLRKFKENDMAGEWARLFDEAGAKYVMPVGIHHDSFALYNSDIQKTYNSVTQAGLDYIGELKKACTSRGLKFGISNHFAENDWFFTDEPKDTAGTDLAETNPDGTLKYGELYGDALSKSEAHIRKWYAISMEIINKYSPDMIYYDFDLVNEAFSRYDDANRHLMLYNYYKHAESANPDGVVCCYKCDAFTEEQALLDKERSSLDKINPLAWQTDTSIGKKSWGYTTDEVYRSGDEFIGALIDIVSKNGNLLLNVGPMSDGTIPEKAKEALLTIGRWLKKYGAAIYSTRPYDIYGEGQTSNTGDSFTYNETDIRFTKSKNGDMLYAAALAAPSKNVMEIHSLRRGSWNSDTVKSISLLNGDNRIPLKWTQNDKALVIELPADKPDTPYAVEFEFFDGKVPEYKPN